MCDRVSTLKDCALASGQIDPKKRGKALAILSDGGEDALTIFTSYAVNAGIDVVKHKQEETLLTYAADEERQQLSWVFSVRGLKALIADLELHSKTDLPIRLVLIDTLEAVVSGAGINTGIGPMGMVMRLMKEICKRYGASVIWLHHTTKDSKDIAAASAEITRVTNSNHFLRRTKQMDTSGREVAELETKKHRGQQETRRVHYVMDKAEGIKVATFADEAKLHGDRIVLELYHEQGAMSPTCIAENLGEGLTRAKVRRICSELRIEQELTDTYRGNWILSGKGKKYAAALMAKRAEEMTQSNWDEPTDQSSAAA